MLEQFFRGECFYINPKFWMSQPDLSTMQFRWRSHLILPPAVAERREADLNPSKGHHWPQGLVLPSASGEGGRGRTASLASSVVEEDFLLRCCSSTASVIPFPAVGKFGSASAKNKQIFQFFEHCSELGITISSWEFR